MRLHKTAALQIPQDILNGGLPHPKGFHQLPHSRETRAVLSLFDELM
jgi:hypothetical protein